MTCESCKPLLEENVMLRRELETALSELAKYKNSNTPSSANKHLKENTAGKKAKEGAKRGAPKGHKGKTRVLEPERHEIVHTDRCPICGGVNTIDDDIINRVVEDTPDDMTPEVVASTIHVKKCLNCNRKFIPPQNRTPLQGSYGINVMVLVVFLKFLLRGVLRKTALFMESGFALEITPASVNSIIQRVAEAAEMDYEDLKRRIRNAPVVYVDETGFSVLGKNQWVWVFRTKYDVLLVIRPSRGSNILQEILGDEFKGTVSCDCWSAYNFLKNANLQRCWAHLLRKTKEFTSPAGLAFHESLQGMFREIKDFNETGHSQMERDAQYEEMTGRLEALLAEYSQHKFLEPVRKYIDNKLGEWFTCVRIEGVEPTNNLAEQAIRETVMVRKIIGAFRSEDGKESYEILASLMATWKLCGLDLRKKLKEMLINRMCLNLS